MNHPKSRKSSVLSKLSRKGGLKSVNKDPKETLMMMLEEQGDGTARQTPEPEVDEIQTDFNMQKKLLEFDSDSEV